MILKVNDLTVQEASLYTHLVEVLCFFIRQHKFASKFFTLSEGLHIRVAQLMSCPQKHLKLSTSCLSISTRPFDHELGLTVNSGA